jgi:hypothetical protein
MQVSKGEIFDRDNKTIVRVDGIERVVHHSTRLLYSELTPEQEKKVRFSWSIYGRFLYQSYEQWENGFLTERCIDREIDFWFNAAKVIEATGIHESMVKDYGGRICLNKFNNRIRSAIAKLEADPQSGFDRSKLNVPALTIKGKNETIQILGSRNKAN